MVWVVVVLAAGVCGGALADDEALVVTPPGFDRPGVADAAGGGSGRVKITVRDRATNRLTPCRINVVGPDGDFYQPALNRLSPFSLTGQWPETGKGNRQGKGPFRYLGRFFYTTGEVEVVVPAGKVRIEVWKGLQYQPIERKVTASAGETLPVALSSNAPRRWRRWATIRETFICISRVEKKQTIKRSLTCSKPRTSNLAHPGLQRAGRPVHRIDGDDGLAPASGPGSRSERRRGQTWIASGQEYRSTTYGHLNCTGATTWCSRAGKQTPTTGRLRAAWRETMREGGLAIYAHGGYSQAIHADFVQKL